MVDRRISQLAVVTLEAGDIIPIRRNAENYGVDLAGYLSGTGGAGLVGTASGSTVEVALSLKADNSALAGKANTTSLAANSGAALIGTSTGATVEASLAAKPNSTTLAGTSGASLIGYDQSTAYAAGTAGYALLNWVDVCSAPYNADRTGAADSTAAFNSALATGRPVWVRDGTYKISSLTALDRDGVILAGPGPDSCKIIQTSTTADLFTIGAGSVLRYGASISGMSFSVAATKAAGYLVKGSKLFGTKIVNVRCDGYMGLADLVTCQWSTVRDTHCVNMVATNGKAISVRSGGSNLILENFSVDGGTGTQCYAGIYAEEFDGIFVSSGTQMNRCGNGIVLNPPSTKYFDHLFASNLSLDSCSGVGLLIKGGGGSVRRLTFSAGWIGTNTNSGIQVEASATVTGLILDGTRIVNNGTYGVFLQSAVESMSITDSVISGNSTTSSGTYSGIRLENAGTYLALNISNTRIRPIEGFSNSQKYAIEVQTATGPTFTACVIEGCDLSGNVTGAASWASADPRTIFMRNNTGFITEAQGSVTQTAAATTATVAHGLSITPVAGEIFITPHTNITTAATFWVSGITSTQFTINTNAGPAANVTWGWMAQIA
jgi:hypothetical protein